MIVSSTLTIIFILVTFSIQQRKYNKDIIQARSEIMQTLKENHRQKVFEDYKTKMYTKYDVKY